LVAIFSFRVIESASGRVKSSLVSAAGAGGRHDEREETPVVLERELDMPAGTGDSDDELEVVGEPPVAPNAVRVDAAAHAGARAMSRRVEFHVDGELVRRFERRP
jgi:hypothetical protein